MRCISKELATKLKAGAKAGDFNISDMLDMTSSERRDLFAKYIPTDEAKFVNTQFEKALASNKQTALKEWAEATFTGRDKSKLNQVTRRIDELADRGLLSPEGDKAFMEDLVADKLGITITPEEAQSIYKLTEELKPLAETKATLKLKGGDIDIDVPSVEYWEKYKELSDYVESISPTSLGKLLSSSTARMVLLASPKSALTNIIGNSVNSVSMVLTRRLQNKELYGGNGDVVKAYFNLVNDIYAKSGFDISRMKDLGGGRKLWGESMMTSQGPGRIRALNRIGEDIIFSKMLGKPDVAFSAAHFGDSAALNSLKMAKQEGLSGVKADQQARKFLIESMGIEPTKEAAVIRENAIKDAEMSTFTDENRFSDASMAARKLLNTIGEKFGVNLGDLQIPFVKVPATVVLRGVEASGGLLPMDLYNLVKGYQTGDAKAVRDALGGLARFGLGITGAMLLLEGLDPDDYVGEYAFTDASERRLIEEKGASYNSIKIGDKWVSLDYFGGFGSPLVGMMNAKKYGTTLPDKLSKYFVSSFEQLLRTPGLNEIVDTGKYVLEKTTEAQNDFEMAGKDAAIGFFDFVASRVIPSIVGDIAKALDDYERQVSYGSTKGTYEQFISRIPILREQLPIKSTMFGEPIETQPAWSTLAFGARMKEGRENDVINELNRLSVGGELPSLTKVEYTSDRVKKLKEQIGEDKLREAVKWFGQTWQEDIDKLIQTNKYKKMSDEDKRSEIDKIKTKALNEMLKKYHYKKN